MTPRSPARAGAAIGISGMQPPSSEASEATNGKRARTVPCSPPDLLCFDPIWQGSRTPTCSSTRSASLAGRRSRPSVHRNAAALPFFLLFLEFAEVAGHISVVRSPLEAGICML
ncbi:hypothetical protein PAHAL_2G291400 [Panicum hallii]|uniref:Uncharacterized protein n=1 Tax=Panicum hallii TaxID=206008 RepID=A0A2T8KQS7_9POAL|nr:hypothetical protein PAHAL_2G291400 [Panicum hallii]